MEVLGQDIGQSSGLEKSEVTQSSSYSACSLERSLVESYSMALAKPACLSAGPSTPALSNSPPMLLHRGEKENCTT